MFGKLRESEDINKTGCGIGLYISQQIVTRLGGEIEVASVENEGTAFYFTLPLGYEEETIDAEITETSINLPMNPYVLLPNTLTASISKATKAPLQDKRFAEEEEKIVLCEKLIIAVDDQPMNIDVLEMILAKKLEREVVCCYSGETAISRIR